MLLLDFEPLSITEPEKIDTPWSHALPPAFRHSITSHIPGWKALVKLAERDPGHLSQIKSMYPRILPHRDCTRLVELIIKLSGLDASKDTCYVFPRLQVAQACQAYITGPNRTDGHESLDPAATSIRAFVSSGSCSGSGSGQDALYMFAVVFPLEKLQQVMTWWSDTGVAVSSRFAEAVLADSAGLREVAPGAAPARPAEVGPAHGVLRRRIAWLMERAPLSAREKKVQPSDVYLFQSGMAAIYNVHQRLHGLSGQRSHGKSVIFGALFYETKHIADKYGGGLEFFPLGVEMDALERLLEQEKSNGRPVRSVWTEIPSNPLLATPDLTRLRSLADEYGFVLVVDDTIGGVCNIDVLPVADVVVTSLTKLFSGQADVMAGSAVLNPSGRSYAGLKDEFDRQYVNDLFAGDASTLRHNSEDYLHRAAVVNRNARTITSWLYSRSRLGASSIKHILYPTTTPTGTQGNYELFQRPATPEFTPGYGCLFTVEFCSQAAAMAFYDNLHVYHGPHLGAHRNIALPYVYLVYGPGDEDGLRHMRMTPAQIRISVGYEDEAKLLDTFRYAVMKAEEIERSKGGG